MYIEGENPAMSDPDLQHAREALAKLEHLVVQDLFVTETAFHADVILPASAFAEKSGTFTNTDRRVQMARQVIPPPGDARQDLVDHPGDRPSAWASTGPMPDPPRSYRDGEHHALARQYHLGAARARRRRHLSGRCDRWPRQRDHLHRPASRPSRAAARSCRRRSSPPDELPDADFPMVLSTGRVLEHWHTGSMTRRANVLDTLEPEAVAFLLAEGSAPAEPLGRAISSGSRRGAARSR